MQDVLAEKMVRQGLRLSEPARNILLVLGGSLLIAASAQLSVYLPFSPVPITGQTLGVLLVGMTLGSRRGALSMLAYLGEGALGLPVFAAGNASLAYMLGPTGGYLLGFVAAAWLVGALAERGFDRSLPRTFLAFALGSAVIYLFGLAWLARFVPWPGTLAAGMTPFLVGDAVKALVAALLLPAAWKVIGDKP
ncbi:MAG: biotin transporter BioY [Chloroflexi bacterium]|nr:biotin transporter BioY [Chloroflexota bacterium]